MRLLVNHPNAEIVFLTADRHAGKPVGAVFPHLLPYDLPDLVSIDDIEWSAVDVDLVFCALPHGTTQEIVKALLHRLGHSLVDEIVAETREDLISAIPGDVRVVDLSADFRVDDPEVYAEWYGHPHYAKELAPEAVYGLPEFYRDQIRTTKLVANPGCYPTAALLGLVPGIQAGKLLTDDIIIDAKSGVSGAGRGLKENLLFCEVGEGIHPYSVASHRHAPEIEQEVAKAAGLDGGVFVNFTPHLMPMNRGELCTCYVKMADGVTVDDLRHTYIERFRDEPFVHLTPKDVVPSTRQVRGSNHCFVNIYQDRVPGRAIIVSALDNLVRGSSGEAIHNMNLMFNLPETTGLTQAPMFP